MAMKFARLRDPLHPLCIWYFTAYRAPLIAMYTIGVQGVNRSWIQIALPDCHSSMRDFKSSNFRLKLGYYDI